MIYPRSDSGNPALGAPSSERNVTISLFGVKKVGLGKQMKLIPIYFFGFFLLFSPAAIAADDHAMLIKGGEYAYQTHDLAAAEELWGKALSEAEKTEPNGLKVAEALTDLGIVYDETHRYKEAEAAYNRALSIREKLLGPNDLAVAVTVNNLANLYKDQKKYAEAEPFYKRAINISIAKEGANSETLAPSYFNLANLFMLQNKYADAIPLLKRSLQICETHNLGAAHIASIKRKMDEAISKSAHKAGSK